MTSSKHSPHLQFADIVVGIVVQALAGSKRAIGLFDDVAHLMLQHPKAQAWTPSYAIINYGLKPFPDGFTVSHAFTSLNEKFLASAGGLTPRSNE